MMATWSEIQEAVFDNVAECFWCGRPLDYDEGWICDTFVGDPVDRSTYCEPCAKLKADALRTVARRAKDPFYSPPRVQRRQRVCANVERGKEYPDED